MKEEEEVDDNSGRELDTTEFDLERLEELIQDKRRRFNGIHMEDSLLSEENAEVRVVGDVDSDEGEIFYDCEEC